MDTYTITSTVEIEPMYLHSGIKDIISQKLNEKYSGKCVQKYGYVNNILNMEIVGNKMSRVNLNILFTVKFSLECFNPVEGKEIQSKVKMIIDYGIMCEEYGVRILIPKTSFEGTIKDGVLTLKNKREIRKDDIINIKLMTIKYDKKNFSAIANLI